MNVMTVAHVYYDLSERECDTINPLDGDFDPDAPSFRAVVRTATLCNNAKVLESGKISGDASETALLKFVLPQHQGRVSEFQRAWPLKHGIPFNSANKWQVSLHGRPDGQSSLLVLKGAPDKVLGYCDEYMQNGQVFPLDDEIRNRIALAIRLLANVVSVCLVSANSNFLKMNLAPILSLKAPAATRPTFHSAATTKKALFSSVSWP
jgi:magnesium-transporting ATPase (P-type)